jgi:cytochrome c oxidase subunit 3
MDFSNELSPETRVKMKKNLLYVGIFSIVMLFAGLTSAYYVNMGGAFWVVTPLPSGFYISTALIALSSLTLFLSLRMAKKSNLLAMRILLVLSLFLGIGFVLYQFKAYKQLQAKGVYFVNRQIVTTEGRYGAYFSLTYQGKDIAFDGRDYRWNGSVFPKEKVEQMKSYLKAISPSGKRNQNDTGVNDFALKYKNDPMVFQQGNLCYKDSSKVSFTDLSRLKELTDNLNLGRGDFFVYGRYGEDFVIKFNGQALAYSDRQLVLPTGQKLSAYQQNKAAETADNASSFLYILTFLHVLHIVAAIIYLFVLVVRGFMSVPLEKFTLSLQLGGIFWHFLGLLWLYLLLFLKYIP